MFLKKQFSTICVGSSIATALTIISSAQSAHALNWVLDNGLVNSSIPINGSFTIDNESGNPPSLISSDITIRGTTFTAAEAITPLENPVTAIDWSNDSDSLSLSFVSPLTPNGGVVNLDVVSDFNGDLITGNVTATGTPEPVIPEPSTIFGTLTTLAIIKRFKVHSKKDKA